MAAGLARTIDLLKPRGFWLVPSASAQSVPVADLIRESVAKPSAFRPWSETELHCAIQEPDDLLDCRATIREVIARAHQELCAGERLIVNPTSGTKQMSVGATLAALDETVGEIVFTVGQRADGVVVTGTEQVRSLDTSTFFMERDLRQADGLFSAGALFAAGRLLEPYSRADAAKAREKALCLHEWQRMNYNKAAGHAARFSESIRAHLQSLAEVDPLGLEVLGDLLAGADALAGWGDHEEALARYYRAAEQTAKARLALNHEIRPPYLPDQFLSLFPGGGREADNLRNQPERKHLHLSGQQAWNILREAGDPVAEAYLQDRELNRLLQRRNESLYGHGFATVDRLETRDVANRLTALFRANLPELLAFWKSGFRPKSLFSGHEPKPSKTGRSRPGSYDVDNQ